MDWCLLWEKASIEYQCLEVGPWEKPLIQVHEDLRVYKPPEEGRYSHGSDTEAKICEVGAE